MDIYANINEKYKITLSSNKNVHVNDVYNRIFFSTFQIDGVSIYSGNKQTNNDDLVEKDNSQDIDENKEIPSIIDSLEKEQPNSGYRQLPLKSEQNDDSGDSEQYGFFSDYLKSYISPNVKKQIDNPNEIQISIPIDIENPIISLENIQADTNELSMITETIDYFTLENILKDLSLQISYLYDKGFYYTSIPTNSILFVQGKYIIFHIEDLDVRNKEKNYDALINLISVLLKTEKANLLESSIAIKNTNIYFFLKRLLKENILLWTN